jgi:hypothetical protein
MTAPPPTVTSPIRIGREVLRGVRSEAGAGGVRPLERGLPARERVWYGEGYPPRSGGLRGPDPSEEDGVLVGTI